MTQAENSAPSANQQIARAAGTVMVAFIISNLVGVVRGIVITNAFGTSVAMDSFNAANRIAELLFNMVAGGALGSAFIPTFTGFLTKDDRKGAWKLASGVINLVFLGVDFNFHSVMDLCPTDCPLWPVPTGAGRQCGPGSTDDLAAADDAAFSGHFWDQRVSDGDSQCSSGVLDPSYCAFHVFAGNDLGYLAPAA